MHNGRQDTKLSNCHKSYVIYINALCSVHQVLLLHLFNGLFSRTAWVSQYQKGKTSLDLNRARVDGVLGLQWHQLVHMPTVCTSLETDNHTNNLSFNFYSLDALPDAQPTVSKHRRLFMIMFSYFH